MSELQGAPSSFSVVVAPFWTAALGLPQAEDSDFFASGGDSLTAMVLIEQVEEATGLALDPALLYDHPRFEDFVLALESAVDDTVAEASGDEAVDGQVASLQQEGHWLLAQRVGSLVYDRRTALSLPTIIQPSLMDAIVSELRAEEALRWLPQVGESTWQPAESDDSVVWSLSPEASLDRLIAEDGRIPLDVTRHSLRLTVAPHSEGTRILLRSHQMFLDGPSMTDLTSRIYARCSGRPLPKTPGYRGYVRWQRGRLQTETRTSAVETWRERLRSVAFPGGTPLSPDGDDGWGPAAVFLQSLSVGAPWLKKTAASLGVTPFAILLGAFARAVGTRCDGMPFALASSTLNRPEKFKNALGSFASAELTIHRPGALETFAETVQNTLRAQRASRERTALPMEILLEEIGRPGLGHTKFSYEAREEGSELPSPLAATTIESDITRRDLTITVTEADPLLVTVRYRHHRIEHSTVQKLLLDLDEVLLSARP